MAHTKVTKTHSQNTGVANTFSYSGSFDVFKGSEVTVTLDAVALTFTSSTINESASPREYTVDTSAKTIHIGGADLSSGTIVIRPETDMGAPTPRATYAPGSSITSEDLNNNQTQLMRKAMEYDETKLSSTGGTMTGDLTLGEDATIIFEGATDDGYETTLTVTDPTADRTITLPNVTGTVVTTGDTGSVNATMLATNSVDSAELVDGSIDTSHIGAAQVTTAKIADDNVTTAKIANDAINGAKIADDSIDSEHYVDGSIDTAHIADSQITSAKIADGTIVAADLASDAVTTAKITAGNVTTAKIAADAVTGAKLADDAIDSEHYTDGSIDTAHIADANVTTAKLADDAITTAKITDANVTTAKIADDAITIAKVGCEQTTISDSDSHIPTSGAVVDYVTAQIAPIGGLEVIADEESFPETIPAAGVVVSITDAAGIQVNSSGVSTNGDSITSNATITINGFPSSLRGGVGSNADPYVLGTGVGLMVQSTGSSQTYNYHKALVKEADFVQLSDDINDFNSRYRVHAGEPGSDNDEGDLCYDTNADKMKVYDSATSAWKEVTSTGDFKYLFLCPAGGSGSPTLDGSIATYDLRESSNSGSAASVSSAAQLLVSVNGVVQKANTGTSAPAEGFALADANTIVFGSNLASGDSVFIVQSGSAVSIPTPGDGTVSTAKIAADAVTGAKIADNAIDSEHYVDGSIDHVHLANDAVDGDNIADDAINSEHYVDGSIDTAHIAADQITGALIADDAVGAEHIEQLDADLSFADSAKAKFGASNDLQIHHDGSNSFIDEAGTGDLLITATAGSIQLKKNTGDKMLQANVDGSVELYYANTKELETKSGGVKLNGHSESIVTALTSAASVTIDFSLSNHFSCTMGHNIAFGNPTTESVGQSGTIVLTQDGTGSRTASWGSQFLWPGGTAPTLSTAAAAVDRIDYFVAAADKIHCVASLGMA